MLYMPGSNARALEKSRTLACDSLIFDLEDAVAPDAKSDARNRVINCVNQGGYGGREVLVRINAHDTDWERHDIEAISGLPIDGMVLPKIETTSGLLSTIERIDQAGGHQLPVWIMTETARGVLDAEQIYGCSRRIEGVIMGTSDLAKELRIPHTPDRTGFLHLLSHCVLAARVHGLDILDGVHLNFNDLDEFRLHCQNGLNLGFDGKTLIHPKQIDICNDMFSPNSDQIATARLIIDAWRAAVQEGDGVCVVKGRLIENLHVEEAQRILKLADAIDKARSR